MNELRGTVLTIGHSTHAIEVFVALLQQHHVSAVVDVRSAPYSRFNPQFNRKAFAGALGRQGIEYVFLGGELGGRPDDPACYENGRIRYRRVARTERFRGGIDRVLRGMHRYRISLMCAEKEPLECHRTLLVARALDERGVDVAHIHADGSLEMHADAMDRLLDILKLPRGDLLETREDLIAAAISRQEERIGYVDRRWAGRTAERDPD